MARTIERPAWATDRMIELIRTGDPVLIGYAETLMKAERIPVLITDQHMSGLEGGIAAFPRRLLVPTDWATKARRVLVEAGLGAELRDG